MPQTNGNFGLVDRRRWRRLLRPLCQTLRFLRRQLWIQHRVQLKPGLGFKHNERTHLYGTHHSRASITQSSATQARQRNRFRAGDEIIGPSWSETRVFPLGVQENPAPRAVGLWRGLAVVRVEDKLFQIPFLGNLNHAIVMHVTNEDVARIRVDSKVHMRGQILLRGAHIGGATLHLLSLVLGEAYSPVVHGLPQAVRTEERETERERARERERESAKGRESERERELQRGLGAPQQLIAAPSNSLSGKREYVYSPCQRYRSSWRVSCQSTDQTNRSDLQQSNSSNYYKL